MGSQTRNPVTYDSSSGTWDATTVATINDFSDHVTNYLIYIWTG
jgi:hypothetical protein